MASAARKTENSGGFQATHWSVVLRARDVKCPAAKEALDTLCRAYWYPLYGHVRRRGHDHYAAQDLTQEFFSRLVEKEWLSAVSPEKGRFRTFLLAAMDHLLANEWRNGRAIKRGNGQPILSFDEITAGEEHFVREPASEGTPGRLFDKSWAATVLERALTRLQEEFASRGKSAQFGDWKRFLAHEAGKADCEASGRRLNMSAGAVSVAVHRMRERYVDLLRETVAQTLADPSEVDEELSYLFGLLNE